MYIIHTYTYITVNMEFSTKFFANNKNGYKKIAPWKKLARIKLWLVVEGGGETISLGWWRQNYGWSWLVGRFSNAHVLH